MPLFNEFWFQIKSKNTEDETQPQRDAIEEKRAEDGSAEVDNEDNKYREKKGTEKLSNWLAVVVLLFCFGIFGLVLLMDNRLPKPLTLAGRGWSPKFATRLKIIIKSAIILNLLTRLDYK